MMFSVRPILSLLLKCVWPIQLNERGQNSFGFVWLYSLANSRLVKFDKTFEVLENLSRHNNGSKRKEDANGQNNLVPRHVTERRFCDY